ncbi:MAG TPA: hypothetical protein VEG34_15075 [Thermoanaerobaculia bacterium]|nr:hypothetical protein [Thermoanaerobaculia bacterium]
MTASPIRATWRELRGLAGPLFLMAALGLSGCRDPVVVSGPGPLFTVPGKAPGGKTLVHVYWPAPREPQATPEHLLWIGPCDGGAEDLQAGSYAALALAPGQRCLEVSRHWEIGATVFGSTSLGRMELAADRPSFLRPELEPRLLGVRAGLVPVASAAALPEIRRCRRMVPLSNEEIFRQLEKRAF